MLKWFVFAAIIGAGLSEPEVTPEEAGSSVRIHPAPYDTHEARRVHDRERHYDGYGAPKVSRMPDAAEVVPIHGHLNENKARIIEETFNPDYYQRTKILDYRYLNTGGRDYTRSEGGQYLILPKGVRSHEEKPYTSYDQLLEFLRLKNLMERDMKVFRERHNEFENRRHGNMYGSHEGHRNQGWPME